MDNSEARRILAENLERYMRWRQLDVFALSERSGVPKQDIEAMTDENGDWEINSQSLGAIAYSLGLPFYELLRPVMTLEKVRFRANRYDSLDGKNVVDDCAFWLDNYCFLEDVLGVRTEFLLERAAERERADIPSYALKVREQLGINSFESIPSISNVLSRTGVKFWLKKERPSDSFFGLSIAESPQRTAIVVFGDKKISVERQIFSTAHELGHILLHSCSYDSKLTDENDREEKEAHLFAGYFLMPRDAFLRKWGETAGSGFVSRVLLVKRYFYVSYRTVLCRLVEEGLFDQRVYGLFNNRYVAHYRKRYPHDPDWRNVLKNNREPEPLTRHDVPSDRFLSLVHDAVMKEEITASKGAYMLRLPITDFYKKISQWERV